jgi:hypothetical protein
MGGHYLSREGIGKYEVEFIETGKYYTTMRYYYIKFQLAVLRGKQPLLKVTD